MSISIHILFNIFYLSQIYLFITASSSPNKDTYQLSSGIYQADTIHLLDAIVHKVTAVPYAMTPKTFRKSTILQNVTDSDVKKGDKWPGMCVQTMLFNFEMYGNFPLPHEVEPTFNCLEISLYIPYANEKEMNIDLSKRKLSTMLFVHGGSNAGGTSSYMDGSVLAAYGNVIVATINFRLDVLGFLSIPERGKYMSGNYGLWDQLTAIKWLHLNCPEIGCDSDSITLFGHSAGSGDVLFHALSSHSKPLIKRVIMQSGSGLAHWSINYERHLINIADGSPKHQRILNNLFKKTRYINSLNDTMVNYLCITSCNLTLKHSCLKANLVNYGNTGLINESYSSYIRQLRKDLTDELLKTVVDVENRNNNKKLKQKAYKLAMQIRELDMKTHLDEVMLKVRNMDDLSLLFSFIFRAHFSLLYTYHGNNWTLLDNHFEREFDRMNWNRLEELFKTRLDEKPTNMILIKHCTTTLTHFINEAENLNVICNFVNEFLPFTMPNEPNESEINFKIYITGRLLLSQYIKPFMQCYTSYFKNLEAEPENLIDSLLELNNTRIMNEMELCTNQAISFPEKKSSEMNSDFLDKLIEITENSSDASEFEFVLYNSVSNQTDDHFNDKHFNGNFSESYFHYMRKYAIKELAPLTGNTNYLHRPCVDDDFLIEFPHKTLTQADNSLNKMEVINGITSHEAFYFLENDYDFNEIIKHTFIYSSLLNMTTNLLEKLTVIDNDLGVNVCLKQKLLEFYNVTPIVTKDLVENNLVKNVHTLHIMCDFEFNLGFITQLKLRLDQDKNKHLKSQPKFSKWFLYYFSFKPSFNMMLESYLPLSEIYQRVYDQMNKSVVPHFSELDYVFGLPILSKLNMVEYKKDSYPHIYTPKEYDLSLNMMRYWTNFAKYGDPNNRSTDTSWSEFEETNRYYLNINSSSPTSSNEQIASWLRKHEFWYELIPNQIYEQCLTEKAIFDRFIKQSKKNGSHEKISHVTFIFLQHLLTFCLLKTY